MNALPNLFSQNEILMCSIFNLKMFLFTLTILICISCIFSCIIPSPIIIEEHNNNKLKFENFGNNDFFSDKDTINTSYFTIQKAMLTSATNSLIAGEATMYLINDVLLQIPFYKLDIYCNLYVINGNPFGEKHTNVLDNVVQKYLVYLKDTSTGGRILLEKLKKDNDGIYKLHFKSEEIEKYIKYNSIEIVYSIDGKEVTLLNGNLTLM